MVVFRLKNYSYWACFERILNAKADRKWTGSATLLYTQMKFCVYVYCTVK